MTAAVTLAERLVDWPDTLVDPSAFEREQERLARVWTLLGHTRDVAKDGDWFRTTLATRSVFIQRFGDELRGFENRCAHRSYPLRTADKGNGPIICGFHHWRYNAGGQAVGIPQCQQLFGKTPKEMAVGLVPVEIATCGALIFGRFRAPGDDEPLEEFLGESFPIFAAMWSAPENPQFITSEVGANWRLCFHIAVEDYHGPSIHPGTFGKHQLRRDNIAYFRFGLHSAFFTARDPDGLEVMAQACRDGTWRSASYRVFHIFPNVTVSHFRTDREHWYVMVMQYVPVATDRCVMRAWFYHAPFPPSRPYPWHEPVTRYIQRPLRAALVRYYSKQVLREDTVACEKLQAIAHQIKTAPLLGALEERLDWFEDAYATVVRGSTRAGFVAQRADVAAK